MVSWVDDFQKKYEQLDNMITNRHSLIDHSKYFGESEQITKCVEEEIKKYKEESNKRIAELQKKAEHLKSMKPYVEMTMEEFCLAHPNEAPDFINKPTFWPHIPEEQKPGPWEEVSHDEEEGEAHAKPKDDKPKDPKDPSKTPPQTPPKTPPTGAAPAGKTDATAKKDDSKKDAPKDAAKKTEPAASPPKQEEKKEKAAVVKTTEVKAIQSKPESQIESQAVESAAVMASEGIELVKTMIGKAIALFKTAVSKMGEKRQQVTQTAAAERLKVQAAVAAKQAKAKASQVDDDVFKRETRSDICNKTIIRGEDTAKADVKPHHVDLDIESETEEDKCAKEKKKKQMKKHEECIRKCVEAEEECGEKRKRTSSCDDRAEELDKCKKPAKKDPCGPRSSNANEQMKMLNVKQENFRPDTPDQDQERRRAHASLLEESKKPAIKKQNVMVMDESKAIKTNVETVDPMKIKPVQGMMAASRTDMMQQQEIVCARNEGDDSVKINAERVAKFVFEMASGTASLLSEAKNLIEKAQQEQGQGQGVDVEAAYLEAEGKVTAALNHAQMALDSAKGLAKQASVGDQEAIALVEKHAMLAQLLAYRAITMKKEIAKLLADLRGI